jgi:4-hydroxyproline epimerase
MEARGYNPPMVDGASPRRPVQIIDSHTAGEPTRSVIAGGPSLGDGDLQSQLGRLTPGTHLVETPVGMIAASLHADGAVSITNMPSYQYRSGAKVHLPEWAVMHGDIAWGENWFFLVADHHLASHIHNRRPLMAATRAVRHALDVGGIRGQGGALVDHVEFTGPAEDPANSSRNFVLCPGAAFDRSPCGTGTSAKMACLYAEGRLAPGERWRQEGILGTVFEGSVAVAGDVLTPTIRGSAYITAQSTLLFDYRDPFREGIRF